MAEDYIPPAIAWAIVYFIVFYDILRRDRLSKDIAARNTSVGISSAILLIPWAWYFFCSLREPTREHSANQLRMAAISNPTHWTDSVISYMAEHSDLFRPLLFQGEILATIAVAFGIVFESDEYPKDVHKVASKLVLVGVSVELIFFIGLFAMDEHISHTQQETIAALEKTLFIVQADSTALTIRLNDRAINVNSFVDDLKTNRKLSVEIFYLQSDRESFKLASEINYAIGAAKWNVISIEAKSKEVLNHCIKQSVDNSDYPPIGIIVSIRVQGNRALFAYRYEQTRKGAVGKMREPPVDAVVDALKASLIGVPGFVLALPADPDVVDAPAVGTLRIIVGEKP